MDWCILWAYQTHNNHTLTPGFNHAYLKFSDLKVSQQSEFTFKTIQILRPLLLGTNGGLNRGVLLYLLTFSRSICTVVSRATDPVSYNTINITMYIHGNNKYLLSWNDSKHKYNTQSNNNKKTKKQKTIHYIINSVQSFEPSKIKADFGLMEKLLNTVSRYYAGNTDSY